MADNLEKPPLSDGFRDLNDFRFVELYCTGDSQ
jgi:hypothetical protein